MVRAGSFSSTALGFSGRERVCAPSGNVSLSQVRPSRTVKGHTPSPPAP